MEYEVSPLSRMQIRNYVEIIWESVGFNPRNKQPFPIVEFIEVAMPIIDEEFSFEIVSDDEMVDEQTHAETIPKSHTIKVRESIYEGAINGNGRDRMTLAHEVGHYLLHSNQESTIKEVEVGETLSSYRSSEWQAKAFAGELLIPFEMLDVYSVEEISEIFQVSVIAADYHKNKMK